MFPSCRNTISVLNMANIEAGNDRELIIRDLVESYDLTITSSSRPGGICAVSTLINIYEKYGFHTLDRVLRLCVATWEGAPMSFSSNMLNAIARLDNAYGEKPICLYLTLTPL